MKSFFYIVFGGLSALGIGVAFAYGLQTAWPVISKTAKEVKLPKVSFSALANVFTSASDSVRVAVTPHPTDGTTISGMKRTVRYTASEEEDLINAAALSLPSSGDKKITASAYVVRGLQKGGTAIEHNSDKILPIASITKLVTAIVARRLIDPSSRVTISREIMSTYGNTAQFRIGEKYLAGNLYYPLLMVSSNDAAEAFARYYGRAKFIQEMNDFTQSIGAYRTYFADPSGLSPLNVSSANDLVTLLRWLEKNDPEILNITKLKTKTVGAHTWVNPTHFLNWSNYIGGKNGYTPEADRTGAAIFAMDHGKDKYAVVILGSESRDSDVVNLLGKIK